MNWQSKITQKTKYRNTEHEFELPIFKTRVSQVQVVYLSMPWVNGQSELSLFV